MSALKIGGNFKYDFSWTWHSFSEFLLTWCLIIWKCIPVTLYIQGRGLCEVAKKSDFIFLSFLLGVGPQSNSAQGLLKPPA